MPTNSHFARLISEFGQSLGMADLALSDEGICQLVIDTRHVVQVVHVGARDQVLISCRLADHGVDALQAERMARANFLQAGRGVVLCVAPDGRPYMQVAVEMVGCSSTNLCQALEALLDQAERWGESSTDHASGRSPRDPTLFMQRV
jgi:hypothetical protein